VAWETGVLFGLAGEGVDLRPADLIVGTSAGATVAAQITIGVSLAALFERQFEPPEESGEIAVAFDVDSMMEMFASAVRSSPTPTEVRAAIGAMSLRAVTVPEEARRAVIERRLPCHEWPEQTVRLVAVDAVTGEPVVLDNASGVKLVDAVAASCAVPGIWPAVTIDDRRYINGGVRSGTNADLAASYETVVILRPFPPPPGSRRPDRQSSHCRAGPTTIHSRNRCRRGFPRGHGDEPTRSRHPRAVSPRRPRPRPCCRKGGCRPLLTSVITPGRSRRRRSGFDRSSSTRR